MLGLGAEVDQLGGASLEASPLRDQALLTFLDALLAGLDCLAQCPKLGSFLCGPFLGRLLGALGLGESAGSVRGQTRRLLLLVADRAVGDVVVAGRGFEALAFGVQGHALFGQGSVDAGLDDGGVGLRRDERYGRRFGPAVHSTQHRHQGTAHSAQRDADDGQQDPDPGHSFLLRLGGERTATGCGRLVECNSHPPTRLLGDH